MAAVVVAMAAVVVAMGVVVVATAAGAAAMEVAAGMGVGAAEGATVTEIGIRRGWGGRPRVGWGEGASSGGEVVWSG